MLKTHGIKPAPRRTSATWRQFLRQQAEVVVACDLFSVDAISLRRLYVVFFIHHGSRRVLLAGITTNPTRDWVTQVARNVTAEPFDAGIVVKYLIRDRDDKFGPSFDAVWESEGASIVRSPVRAPNANAVAERWIGTVRSECTDRLLILNERHLGRVLVCYVCNYDRHRPHRALGLRPPDPPTATMPSTPAELASICRRGILGALINEYHVAEPARPNIRTLRAMSARSDQENRGRVPWRRRTASW